jgi:polyisoprenoid-binding protein YceI
VTWQASSLARFAPALAFAAAFALAPAARAAPEEFIVDTTHTFAHFEVVHLGISTYRGRLGAKSGTILLDSESGVGSIDVVLDPATVSTGYGKLDAILRAEDLLDVEHFPLVTFRANILAFEKGALRTAQGELDFLGIKRPVVLNVERFGCTRKPFLVQLRCGADAIAEFKRSDFGMNSYQTWVSDEVTVRVQIEAVRRESAPQPQGAN